MERDVTDQTAVIPCAPRDQVRTIELIQTYLIIMYVQVLYSVYIYPE